MVSSRTMVKAFRENPLSLSVSQTAFEAWLATIDPDRAGDQTQPIAKPPLSHHQRQGFWGLGLSWPQLRLPNLDLTAEDLLKPPLPWTLDFFDCGRGPAATYSWPSSWEEAVSRIERNVAQYTGNYVWLAGILLLCVLYKRPLALLGILAAFCLGASMRQLSVRMRYSRHQLALQALRWCLHVGSWVVLFYCRVLPTLSLATLLCLLVVVVHGALRGSIPEPGARQRRENGRHQR